MLSMKPIYPQCELLLLRIRWESVPEPNAFPVTRDHLTCVRWRHHITLTLHARHGFTTRFKPCMHGQRLNAATSQRGAPSQLQSSLEEQSHE